ncbi:hypothetical protein GCM10023149_14640 [Mucilaginibacter gynuensis]|uniref:Outer membrane protein beta-barrel domain-containing protein n=1 Tax=Mucilaginibacter gynuensis TaxID=1302236 RepID=A0ABP8G4I4_9SPHI
MALLCLCFTICCSQNAQCQNAGIEYEPVGGYNAFNQGKGIALVLQYGADIPLDNLSVNYRSTSTYGIGVLKKLDDFTVNFNINYHAYPIKWSSRGMAKNTFEVMGFYFGGAYDKLLSNNFKLYGGLDLGGWIKRFDDLVDTSTDCGCETNNANYYFAPKTGFTYLMNNRIGLGLEAKYNLLLTGHDYVTGENGGKLFNSFATSVMISYHF